MDPQAGTLPPPPIEKPPFTQRKIAGLPAPVVAIGGVALVAFLWIRHKNKQAAASQQGGQFPVSTCAAVDAQGNCIQAGTSQYGPYAYDQYGSPLSPFGQGLPGVSCPYGVDASGNCLPAPSTSGAPTTSTPSTPSTPAPAVGALSSLYHVGEQVAPGETIVQGVYNPADKGSYYLTDKGGVYTAGGTAASDVAKFGSAYGKGNFSKGIITPLPGGGYLVYDNSGKSYRYGY